MSVVYSFVGAVVWSGLGIWLLTISLLIAGVMLGALAGLFIGLPRMIFGPLSGCFVFEMIFTRKPIQPAAKSTLGTAVGTGVGLVSRRAIGLAMATVFFAGAFW